jgi:hypothetical protein
MTQKALSFVNDLLISMKDFKNGAIAMSRWSNEPLGIKLELVAPAARII